jgi:hypothetical protein
VRAFQQMDHARNSGAARFGFLDRPQLSGRDGDDAGQRNPPSFEPATMPRSSD